MEESIIKGDEGPLEELDKHQTRCRLLRWVTVTVHNNSIVLDPILGILK